MPRHREIAQGTFEVLHGGRDAHAEESGLFGTSIAVVGWISKFFEDGFELP